MDITQIPQILVGLAGAVSVVLGIQHVRRQQAFQITPLLYPLGILVWGDAPLLGAFWVLIAVTTLLIGNASLFWLCVSLFWVVRGLGETVYWLLQQFSPLRRNPPQNLFGYRWVKDESLWFMYQLFWQCTTVAAVLASIYFAHQWLG